VRDAAVVMATPANKGILRQAGLMLTEIESARADDLVIVVLADNKEAAARALHEAEGYLVQRSAGRNPVRHPVRAAFAPLHAAHLTPIWL